jgi:hypothetical protein
MGRRWGKTVLGGMLTMNVLRQHGYVAWIVPFYKNGRALWRYAHNVCAGPIAAGAMQVSKTDRVITTTGGGFFGIYSGDNIDSIRSERFNLVVGDEAARLSEEGYYDAVVPTLADADGDSVLISTPVGKNWFYNEFMAGKQGGDQASWTAPTYANPSPQIRAAYKKIKARTDAGYYSKRSFRQEWDAEFVADGAFFPNIEACAKSVPADVNPEHLYVIGVDWARATGGDFTVFSVIDATDMAQAEIVRLSGMPYDDQLNRLRMLFNKYYRPTILAEYNSMGGPLVERLQIEGLPVIGFTTTNSTKHDIMTALEGAFDRMELKILDDPAQVQELSAFERKERAGLPAYGAPEGMHDDTVIALALAYWMITGGATWTSF